MSAGIILVGNDINSMVGGCARDLNNLMIRIQQMQTTLLVIGASGLENAPFNFNVPDTNNLLSAASDMDFLRQVYQGVAAEAPTHSGVYDFRTFSQRVWGWGF